MNLPIGKLPPDLLKDLLSEAPLDERVLLGPGIGLDCAVVDSGDKLLVYKSDPITFASDAIGWYAVQVNANDLATTGALPKWFLATLLLPEEHATKQMAWEIMEQVYTACRELDISVIGGHTEITHGIDRPILSGTMIGEVNRKDLVTPQGARHGDALLLTKGVPIEATAILAREFHENLSSHMTDHEINRARDFLYHPGISVLKDAQTALRAGSVHAMHDPTEGGIYAALWELAEASNCSLLIEPQRISIPEISFRVLEAFTDKEIDPYSAIASGALLLAVQYEDAVNIMLVLRDAGIDCMLIGNVKAAARGGEDLPLVWQEVNGEQTLLPRPSRDAITALFET